MIAVTNEIERGGPLWWALVIFAACVMVLLLALWAAEEYDAWMGRLQRRAEMPHPGVDLPPHAREQWPRIFPVMVVDTASGVLPARPQADVIRHLPDDVNNDRSA